MPAKNPEITKFIRQAIKKERSLSQTKLAIKYGVSQSTVSRILKKEQP